MAIEIPNRLNDLHKSRIAGAKHHAGTHNRQRHAAGELDRFAFRLQLAAAIVRLRGWWIRLLSNLSARAGTRGGNRRQQHERRRLGLLRTRLSQSRRSVLIDAIEIAAMKGA